MSIQVPADWVDVEPARRFVHAVGDPAPGGPRLDTTRVFRIGSDEATRAIHEEQVADEASLLDAAHTTIDGHPAQVLRYEEASPEDPEEVRLVTEHLIELGDGTHVLVSARRAPGAEHDADVIDTISASISIDDPLLPIELRELSVDDTGLAGEYWTAPHDGPRPGVLFLGGSEGGLPYGGGHLALAGYATLALAYFDAPGLPDELAEIPLEHFADAIAGLGERPEVDADRIHLWGGSRGGEAVLLLAATYPELVAGVVANVPANVVHSAWPGDGAAWTHAGEPVPGVTYPYDPRSPADRPDLEIPVERIDAPIVFICGGLDRWWLSCPMSRAAVERLERHDHPHPVELHAYDDEGHRVVQPPGSVLGDPREDGSEAWNAAVAFLDRTS